MRANIELWIEHNKEPNQSEPKISEFQFEHVYLGSREKSTTYAVVEQEHTFNSAFYGFRERLGSSLNSELKSVLQLPDHAHVYLEEKHEVSNKHDYSALMRSH